MEDRQYSEEVGNTIDREVRAIMDEGHEHAKGLLSEHRPTLAKIVALLLTKETLERAEFRVVMTPEERAVRPGPDEKTPDKPDQDELDIEDKIEQIKSTDEIGGTSAEPKPQPA